jgi:fibronectin type 3 domain-containing protein
VESANSKTITVINSDTYPPKPPTEVTAISNGQFISVVWLPNAEPDLAGYWVYRAKTDRNYERLTEQLINAASTIDKRVEKGQTYFYRVKAVDIKGNESDLSEEVSDTVN